MIEFISTKINDDELWLNFFNLSREIIRKHYPDNYKEGDTVDKFISRRKNNAAKDESYREFVVLQEGKPCAWLDTSVWNGELYCGFDMVNETLDEDLLKAVLIKFEEIMKAGNFSEALYYTYREAIYGKLKNAGAAVDEEYMISRLERKDMDVSFYNGVIHNSPLEKWKLIYYSELPDDMIERYAVFCKNAFDDIFALNPFPAKCPVINADYVRSVMESHKKSGTVNPMYMLFDDAGEIAGLSSICQDSSNMETLRHVGSLTAVASNHRGKGIAKYLKAKLYLKLLEENKEFRYITTDTMPWNKYMYKINDEFGFKPYRKGMSFRISRDFITNYLKLN